MTDALKREGKQELIVSVWDPVNDGFQPRGKQVKDPKGIWYTPVTGIWQTVWLETVSKTHVESLHMVPNVDAGKVRVTANVSGSTEGVKVKLHASLGDQTITAEGKPGEPIEMSIPNAKLWSPSEPNLYDLSV